METSSSHGHDLDSVSIGSRTSEHTPKLAVALYDYTVSTWTKMHGHVYMYVSSSVVGPDLNFSSVPLFVFRHCDRSKSSICVYTYLVLNRLKDMMS